MASDELARLYPDIVEAGDLSALMTRILAEGGHPWVVDAKGRATSAGRAVHLSRALDVRAFHVQCWFQGVCYGSGWSPSPEQAAAALADFLAGECSAEDMQARHPWFEPTDGASHELGPAAYVERAWTRLLSQLEREDWGGLEEQLYPLAKAASHRPELRQLMPFTSMYFLRFSRCTGYPFSDDCPSARPLGDGRYEVSGPRGAGERGATVDDADAAADQLVRLLPPGIGPAVHGTDETIPPLD